MHFSQLPLDSSTTYVSTVGLWLCGFLSLDLQIYALKFRREGKNFSQKHFNLQVAPGNILDSFGHACTFLKLDEGEFSELSGDKGSICQ